jgi:hypothetical protein
LRDNEKRWKDGWLSQHPGGTAAEYFPLSGECVAKLFAALRASNNRIQLSGVLNLCCVLMLVLESILLIWVVKIVLQHIPRESGHHRKQSSA